jgi:hypothetical protein
MKSVSSRSSTRGREDDFLSVRWQIECMSLSIQQVSEEMFLFLVRLIPFLLSLSPSLSLSVRVLSRAISSEAFVHVGLAFVLIIKG